MATDSEVLIKDELIPSIQIISDIHLEFSGVFAKMEEQNRFPKSGAPILVLLGDIGYPHQDTYWQFIDTVLNRFKYIIIITGNHEYYQNEYNTVHQLINDKILNTPSYKNKVYFLNNKSLELSDVLPNIRILGTTMWVNYPQADEDENIAIQYEYRINDFRRITYDNTDEKDETKQEKLPLLTSPNVNTFHHESVTFLQSELNKAKEDNKNVIILTHHAPTNYKSIYPECDYKTEPLGYGMNYASMEYLFKKPLIGWFFGHTHFNCDFLLKCKNNWTVRIASNQQGYIMGYNKDRAPKDYSDKKIIIFPNEDERNKDVEVVEMTDFDKYLVDKTQLIPDGKFFQKKIENNVKSKDNANKKQNVDHNDKWYSFCQIL